MSQTSRALKRIEKHRDLFNRGFVCEAESLVLGDYWHVRDKYYSITLSPLNGADVPNAMMYLGIQGPDSYEVYSFDASEGGENLAAVYAAFAAMVTAESPKWTAVNSTSANLLLEPRDGNPVRFIPRICTYDEANLAGGEQVSVSVNGTSGGDCYMGNENVLNHVYTKEADNGARYGLFGETSTIPGNADDDYVIFDHASCEILHMIPCDYNRETYQLSIGEYVVTDRTSLDFTYTGQLFAWDEVVTIEYDEELNRTLVKFKDGHGLPDLPGSVNAFSITRRDAGSDMEGFYSSRALYYLDENTLYCPFSDCTNRRAPEHTHFLLVPAIVKGGEGSNCANQAFKISFTYDPELATFSDW